MTKELLKQALDALLCCSPDSEVGAAMQIKTVKSLRAELAQPHPWREAIDSGLVCLHLGTADSFPSAQAALAALIDWHVSVALDPAVSSDAQALVDRGAAVAEPLTERELELIDGMIEVQLHHAKRTNIIHNRTMAERQKGWDMERVELLRKLRDIGIKGSAA